MDAVLNGLGEKVKIFKTKLQKYFEKNKETSVILVQNNVVILSRCRPKITIFVIL